MDNATCNSYTTGKIEKDQAYDFLRFHESHIGTEYEVDMIDGDVQITFFELTANETKMLAKFEKEL
jgi:hypothetical protein